MKGLITNKKHLKLAWMHARSCRPWESFKSEFVWSLCRCGYGATRAWSTADHHIKLDSIPEWDLPQRVPLEALEE